MTIEILYLYLVWLH